MEVSTFPSKKHCPWPLPTKSSRITNASANSFPLRLDIQSSYYFLIEAIQAKEETLPGATTDKA